MAKTRLRLLLLSAGSLVAQRLIEALGERRSRCILIGANSVAAATGNFCCDIAYLVPAAASVQPYIERIAELIREERPDLVIPCRDDDISALAMLKEQLPPGDTVMLTGTVAAARVINDKLETARFAEKHGLAYAPTARDVREALELAKAHRLPLIGKPRSGYATRGVVLLRSFAEIERAFELRPDLIAQPFIDPPANMDALIAPYESGLPFFFSFPTVHHSVQIIVGPDATVSDAFPTLNTQVGGIGTRMARLDDPELVEIGRAYGRAAAAEGWKGPLNIQLRRTPEGRPLVFELNGRFTGSTAARALMGFDEIGEVISRFLPQAVFPPLAAPQSDIVQLYLRSRPLPRVSVAALEASGRWSRSIDRGSAPDLPA